MKKLKKYSILTFVVIILSAFAISKGDNYFEITKNLEIFSAIYKEISKSYVEEVKPGEVITEGINAMLSTLDPYTVYYPESKIEDYRFETTGEYGGVGATLTKVNGKFYITDIIQGSPADEAGLYDGDEIISIDGKEIENKSIEEVSQLIKGQSGTSAAVEYKSLLTDKTETINVNRQNIKSPDVPYYGMFDNNVGYIALSSFTATAANSVKKAYKELEKNGAKRFVLDLRGNGGGLLIQAVDIVNMFVPKGVKIVETKGKLLELNQRYETRNEPENLDAHLVVLVNGGSASASEIVSGAIQDLDRGVVLGDITFGKGLVQRHLDLPYKSKMKLTVSKYHIPSGRCIQKLDYAHKDALGRVMEVPDTLLKTFKTKNGRTVKDGRGVMPDVMVKEPFAGEVINQLMARGVFFQYANLYKKNNPDSIGAKDFKLSDNEFDKFVVFASNIDLDYKNQSSELLDILEEISEEERIAKDIAQDLELLKSRVKPNTKKDLYRFKDQAMELLQLEIVKKDNYFQGQYENRMANDPYLMEAIAVLNDTSRYKSILGIE